MATEFIMPKLGLTMEEGTILEWLVEDGAAITPGMPVLRIETVQNGQWRRMTEGISTEHWSTMDTRSFPTRFDRYAQVMVYPKADQVYTLRFWFVGDL
ncbi:MAG: hypothetical protein EBY07_07075, partial [Actinobacteria bacterium]|nr:hypothetical protein [Actinomycetota bacterium]